MVASSILMAAASALVSWLAVAAIRPWLGRRAIVQPNRRSSHVAPTPQGAGIAVIVAVLLGMATWIAVAGMAALPAGYGLHIAVAVAGTITLCLVGLIDDIGELPVTPRIVAQVIIVLALVLTLPRELRLLPSMLPLPVERLLIGAAALWFINLYNFMDGIDLMSVTETATIAAAVLLFAWLGLVPGWIGVVAACLFGAVLGFTPWNWPPARLFLGDAGSLPISLLAGMLLLHTSFAHALTAALIVPLYYLLDATVTLCRRIARREPVLEGHRQHFYQRALDNGHSVRSIVGHVAVLNAVLVLLAVVAARYGGVLANLSALLLAVIAVSLLLWRFSSPSQGYGRRADSRRGKTTI